MKYVIEWWNASEENYDHWSSGPYMAPSSAIEEFYKQHPYAKGVVLSLYEYKGGYLDAEPTDD